MLDWLLLWFICNMTIYVLTLWYQYILNTSFLVILIFLYIFHLIYVVIGTEITIKWIKLCLHKMLAILEILVILFNYMCYLWSFVFHMHINFSFSLHVLCIAVINNTLVNFYFLTCRHQGSHCYWYLQRSSVSRHVHGAENTGLVDTEI